MKLSTIAKTTMQLTNILSLLFLGLILRVDTSAAQEHPDRDDMIPIALPEETTTPNEESSPVSAFTAEGCFAITFPDQSVLLGTQSLPTQTAVGTTTMETLMKGSEQGVMMVAYSDYPPALFKTVDPASMLTTIRKGAIANTQGELLSERPRTLQGFPANEFIAKGKDGVLTRTLVLVIGNRVYIVAYSGMTEADVASERADAYLSSFSVDFPCRAAQGGDTIPVSMEPLLPLPFTSSEGCFSTLLPQREGEDLEALTLEQETAAGSLVTTMYVVRQGGREHVISFTDYLDIDSEFIDPYYIMQQAQREALKPVEGELVDEEILTVQGLPALEYRARGNFGGVAVHIRVRMIWSDRRLYQVIYGESGESEIERVAVENYFETFRINPVCRAEQGADTVSGDRAFYLHDFSSSDACFRILFPRDGSRPVQTTRLWPIKNDSLQMDLYGNYNQSDAFLVGSASIPGLQDIGNIKRSLLKSSVSKLEGKMTWEREMKWQGFVAKEYHVEYVEDSVATYHRVMNVIAADRYFEVRLVSRSEQGLRTATADAFFQSFRIDTECLAR